jgi:hypothetical protein
MQHIPHTNLEEKHVWPNLTLTGEDIHNAYCRVEPDNSKPWDLISQPAKEKYEAMARELNSELDARQAWFEGADAVTISAVRCSVCGEMLQGEHAEGHACWLKEAR